MSARDLTGADLLRALGSLTTRPAVDAAVRIRAEAIAARIEGRAVADGIGDATSVRVIRRGAADYAVAVSAPNLFAREFGALDAPAAPLIGAAVADLKP